MPRFEAPWKRNGLPLPLVAAAGRPREECPAGYPASRTINAFCACSRFSA